MKKKSVIVIILALIASMSFSGAVTVQAGFIDKILIDETFSGNTVSTADWYSRSKTGIGLEDDYDGLVIRNGYTGTGVISSEKISGGAAVEIDAKKLDWNGNQASLYISFGIDKNGENPHYVWQDKAGYEGTGVFICFNKDCDDYALRLACAEYYMDGLVDGEGNALPMPTPYSYTDVKALSDNNSPDTVTDKTIRFEYFSDGSFVLSVKRLGTSDDFSVVARTSANKLKSFPTGYVAMYVMEGASGFNYADIRDVRIYRSGEEIPSFEFGENFSTAKEDYIAFKHDGTTSFVFGAKKSLTFGSAYKNGNPLFLRSFIETAAETDEKESLFTMEFTLSVKDLSAGRQFGILTGAQKMNSGVIGQEKTSYLYFEKDGGFYLRMDAYDVEGEPRTVIPRTALASAVLSSVNVKAVMGSNGTLKVAVGEETVFSSGDNDFYYGGYAGFAANGEGNELNISVGSFKADNAFYDRPENVEIFTDFTDNEFDAGVWKINSTSYLNDFVNGVYVKDEALYFDNVANESRISTKYAYSDFSLEFSIKDLRRTPVRDGDDVLYPVCSWIGVIFGAAFQSGESMSYMEQYYPLVYFESPVDQTTWDRVTVSGNKAPTRLVILNLGGNRFIDLPDKYDFWDETKAGLTVNVKITLKDGRFFVGVKYSSESMFYTVTEIELDYGITGYIHICGTGNNYYQEPNSVGASCGNFVLDDIKLSNLDEGKNIVGHEFISSKVKNIPGDYMYSDGYADNAATPVSDFGGGCGGNVSGGEITLVIASIAFFVLVFRGKRSKSK